MASAAANGAIESTAVVPQLNTSMIWLPDVLSVPQMPHGADAADIPAGELRTFGEHLESVGGTGHAVRLVADQPIIGPERLVIGEAAAVEHPVVRLLESRWDCGWFGPGDWARVLMDANAQSNAVVKRITHNVVNTFIHQTP